MVLKGISTKMEPHETSADCPQEKMNVEMTFLHDEVSNTDFNSKTDCEQPFNDTRHLYEDNKFGEEEEPLKVDFEVQTPKYHMYNVSENPPVHWAIMCALQQAMINVAAPLTTAIVVCEVACGQEDDALKLQILSTTLFMVGVSTVLMCTFGVRLPIFQGPAPTYLFPLLALQALDDWKCPRTFEAWDPQTNSTVLMADMGNGTFIPNREISLDKISVLSGSMLAAGVFHFLIGASGLVGIVIRYIGPITIVPTIVLIGLQFHMVVAKFLEADWLVGSVVCVVALVLSLYLSKYNTPVPMWNRQKGFYIHWHPVHQVLSILLTLAFGLLLATILTYANYYTDDPTDRRYLARTDARSFLITETDWFILPISGRFGRYGFSVGIFINYMVSTLSSTLDSIGDYSAAARVARVSPVPPYALNRGLTVEGTMCTLSALLGACHATVSFGGNIGAIGITRVASRRVFQIVGIIYIILAIFGKFGAFFVSMPYSVLGGVMIVTQGIFIGMLLSYLQLIDLNSVRNLAIIGITLLLGLSVTSWVSKNPSAINTGSEDVDGIIQMLFTNPGFVGGVFSAFLDNTVPGTLKERGLLAQMKDLDDVECRKMEKNFAEGPETYRLSFLSDSFRRSRLAKIIPLFDTKVS